MTRPVRPSGEVASIGHGSLLKPSASDVELLLGGFEFVRDLEERCTDAIETFGFGGGGGYFAVETVDADGRALVGDLAVRWVQGEGLDLDGWALTWIAGPSTSGISFLGASAVGTSVLGVCGPSGTIGPPFVPVTVGASAEVVTVSVVFV